MKTRSSLESIPPPPGAAEGDGGPNGQLTRLPRPRPLVSKNIDKSIMIKFFIIENCIKAAFLVQCATNTNLNQFMAPSTIYSLLYVTSVLLSLLRLFSNRSVANEQITCWIVYKSRN